MQLQFADIVSISFYRTTSIRIEIDDHENETYVFKSFHNREHVLQLLLGLKRLADKKKTGHPKPAVALRTQSERRESGSHRQREEQQKEEELHDQESMELRTSSDVLHTSISSSSFLLPGIPSQANRRRAVSDSMVRFLGLQEDRPALAGDLFLLPDSNETNGSAVKEAWEAASQTISTLEESGIEVRAFPGVGFHHDSRPSLTLGL